MQEVLLPTASKLPLSRDYLKVKPQRKNSPISMTTKTRKTVKSTEVSGTKDGRKRPPLRRQQCRNPHRKRAFLKRHLQRVSLATSIPLTMTTSKVMVLVGLQPQQPPISRRRRSRLSSRRTRTCTTT